MKLAVICDDFPSEGRPVYVFVEQLVNELARQGVEVVVIAPQSLTRHFLRHVPLLPKKTIINNNSHAYTVYRPYSISLGSTRGWVSKLLEMFRYMGIKKCLAEQGKELDAIYGHFWHSAFVARKYAYQNNIPMFVACGEGDDSIALLIARMTEEEKKEFSNGVKGVISVSSENKRRCIQFGLSKEEDIIVLPNSVDSSIFIKDENRNIRKELGVTDDDFLIVFTGHFIHRKGSDRLSAAIDKLNDCHIKVAFIGGSPEGYDANPTCKGIVHMGKVKHEDVPQYLFAADCFCLPTLNEGCSNAIVEALACGLPVISSNLPFNEDILDETNSITVDPMDVDQIAEAIAKIKDTEGLKEKLSKGASVKATDLRIDNRADKIIKYIQSRL